MATRSGGKSPPLAQPSRPGACVTAVVRQGCVTGGAVAYGERRRVVDVSCQGRVGAATVAGQGRLAGQRPPEFAVVGDCAFYARGEVDKPGARITRGFPEVFGVATMAAVPAALVPM